MPDMPLLSRGRSVVEKDQIDGKDGLNTNTNTNNLVPERRPKTARPVSDYGFFRSRLSQEVQPQDVLDTDDESAIGRTKRFSMLKKFNLSESALTARAKEAEKTAKEITPPMPALPSAPAIPAIVKTAPTMDHGTPEEEATEDEGVEMKARPSLFKRTVSKGRSPDKRGSRQARKSGEEKRSEKDKPRKSADEKGGEKKASLRWRKLQGRSTGLEDLQRLASANVANNLAPPPRYGDESNSALALPVFGPRLSESTASDGSNASSDQIYGATTTTTHTVSTHTTFFKLPRRNQNRNSLFPLPVRISPPPEDPDETDEPTTPRASVSDAAVPPRSQSAVPGPVPNGEESIDASAMQRRHTESPRRQPRVSTNATPAKQSLSFAATGVNLMRNDSEQSRGSSPSSPLEPPRLGMRDRASTASSPGRGSCDMSTPPPIAGSGRTSTSTTGRSSFGALLNISRFRQSSEPHSPRHGSPGAGSKSNSFAMSREALVVPEREEGDTPGKYLERLEAAVARSMIAGILSKSADPFAQAVLRSYTRRFPFFGEPIDMSLRKFLLEAELPKETQQVDRVIQAFADRYHECNPGIFVSPDQAYIIAFSLMMLHTDAFNKNNKRKMQKQDYIKNTSGQSVSDDILGCFYDNICYTPFVHYEEEVDINGERILAAPFKPKKSKLNRANADSSAKKGLPTGPVDPYNLLVDQKLEFLRPAIRESIMMDDPYNYRTSQTNLDPSYLQRAFTHTGVLQIISQRSRPTAYEGQLSANGGEQPSLMEMQPGIIDLKITKVGTLWRKAAKKKKARSPWQEWGAVLTGSQLYLFKNAHWAKGLVHQFTAAQKFGHARIPVVFKPPLQEFKPDGLIKTDNAVALVDGTYNRHKNAFTVVRPGGFEEVLLADNEGELNDWLALINYAAAFRAAGVRIRGMLGGAEEDLRARELRRLESVQSARSAQTVESSLSVQRGALSPQEQRQIMDARRQIMVQKIGEAAKDISEADKELDNMLRNARHLLILAPIAPRTREDIIHAAARADASIKWARRDIWRMKCHKDILAMDVQQDGVSAAELEMLAEQQAEASDSAKKTRPKGLSRLTSVRSVVRSPPQSPTGTPQLERPATTESLDTYISNDIFRAPPESVAQERQSGDWRIPPLQLDVLKEEQAHRASVTSTLLSTSTGRQSVSNASTMSSIRHVASDEPIDGTPRRRNSSVDDTKTDKLPRTNTSPDGKGMNVDGATPTATPDSSKQKSGVRRSLQKTLRDSHHHHTGSSHKHRRGKESDSTIRSANTAESEETVDGTPGLKREQGRFILHGKQASIVQFGSDWPDEKMRQRRELWRQSNASSQTERTPTQRQGSFSKNGFRYDMATRLANDLTGNEEESHDELSSPPDSSGTVTSATFKSDALAAEAFATSASPERLSSASEQEVVEESGEEFAANGLPDMPKGKKRETVIGPKYRRPSLQKGEDGTVVSDDESEAHSETSRSKEKRRTVIGPIPVEVNGSDGSTEAGAEEDDDTASASLNGDDEGTLQPIETA